jgi:uncharacterized protein YjbI with pentapeptide repeats
MGLFNWFSAPKPAPCVVLKNVLGEVLLQIPGRRDLIGANLKGINLAHADLSGMSLQGANLEGICLFGARLRNTSFQKSNLRNADLAYALTVAGANFRGADLSGCDLRYAGDIERAHFDEVTLSRESCVPGMIVV